MSRSTTGSLIAAGWMLFALGTAAFAQPAVSLTPRGGARATTYQIDSWAAFRRSFGEASGFDVDFSRVEGFLPLWSNSQNQLAFFDGRVVNFDDSQDWQCNLGGGWRMLSLADEWIIGLNAFYDGRSVDSNYYQQFGLGWELLGETCEARGNFYFPGADENEIYTSDLFGLHFVESNIEGSRIRQLEASVGGLDLEVGTGLPVLPACNPRAYAGYYHFGTDEYQAVDGVRGRLEAFVGDNMTVHLAVQHDSEYDTTVSGGLAIYFRRYGGGSRLTRLVDKMGQRVVRDPAVMIARRSTTTSELLTDPDSGEPLVVRHLSSSAAPGGDGTYEHPFSVLADAEMMSDTGDILFAHAGSNFDGEDIWLQQGQRLLGEGIDHMVTATQGEFLLPSATGGTDLPIFVNSVDSTVQLADDSEVSGLDIRDAGDNAIAGDDVANVNVNRNVITAPLDDGIDLDNVSGTNRIVGNTINETFENGIELTYDDSTVATIEVSGNSIDLADLGGVVLVADDDAQVTLNITGNTITDTLEDAIVIVGEGDSVLHVTVYDNEIDGSGFSSVFADLYDGTHLTLRVLDNDLLNYDDWGFYVPGVEVDAGNESVALVQVAGNTINSSMGLGVGMVTFDEAEICAQVSDNTSNGDFEFLRIDTPNDVFNLEDTLSTNTFLGGAAAFVEPDVTIVSEGFCGFPDP